MGLVPVLLIGSALAADVDAYQPSSSLAVGRGTLQGESASVGEDGPAAALMGGVAQDAAARGAFWTSTQTTLVAAQVPVSLYGGWTFGGRARVDAFVPTYAWVDAPVTGYSGPALGDLRLQGVITAWRGRGVAVGVAPRLELPTGTTDAQTRRGLSAGGSLLVDAETRDGSFGWLANLGGTAAPPDSLLGVGIGSTLDALTGLWLRPQGSFRVGAELDGRVGLVAGRSGDRQNVWSTHLFAQQLLDGGWGLTVGGGTGVAGWLGAPEYRAIAAVHFGATLPDADGDGLIGDADLCPDEPEDPDGFEDTDGCPDPDDDGDQVADADDRCPGQVEDFDGFEDDDGCPDDDNDGDGLADAEDPCPDKAGRFEGCPDSDLDGLPDHQDACPDRQKPATERREFADGCPKPAWFDDFSIAHAAPVRFERGTTTPTRASEEVLSAVLGLLLSHPEVAGIEIQASTAPEGGSRADQELTQARAEALVDWFVERSLDRALFTAVGKGQGEADVVFRITRVDRARKAHPAPAEGTAEQEASPGNLSVVITGGLEGTVFLDGRRLGRAAPFTDQPIAPGSHEVRVTNLDLGLDETRTIEVRPAEFVRVVIDGPAAEALPDEEVPWEPVRPERPRPEPIIDVQREQPKGGKRPPRSSKKR